MGASTWERPRLTGLGGDHLPACSSGSSVIYLVRHARAGERTASPEDHLRPLNAEGWRQTETLTTWVQPSTNGRVLSSPYVRCVATVEPLAARAGHRVI